jgi:hypothetical protein
MPHPLVDRSPDLRRLHDEGYAIEIRGPHLLVHDIPYVNSEAKVKTDGTLVSGLTLNADVTIAPGDHTCHFIGDAPCNQAGEIIAEIYNGPGDFELAGDLKANHYFSFKPVPSGAYRDYHHKMTTYIHMISGPAERLDPGASPRTRRVIPNTDPESVFEYKDTASARAEITAITEKLTTSKIAIVGVGGTGSYILDFIGKSPVAEIHLYDDDRFLQHNAFRTPGAASLEELKERPTKVAYLRDRSSKLHRKIYAHVEAIDEQNVGELAEMTFVFLAMDRGPAWRLVVEKLQEWGIPFVDVGMDLYVGDGALGGQVRTTTSTPEHQLQLPEAGGTAGDGDGRGEYDQNIQIVELNALNAAHAVIRWKKHLGFYRDYESEHSSIYTIGGNTLLNGEKGA